MYKAGDARPLLLPFPMFMWMDIASAARRSLTRNKLPPNVEATMERMRFQTVISGNYVKAFILLIFSFIAGMLVFQQLR